MVVSGSRERASMISVRDAGMERKPSSERSSTSELRDLERVDQAQTTDEVLGGTAAQEQKQTSQSNHGGVHLTTDEGEIAQTWQLSARGRNQSVSDLGGEVLQGSLVSQAVQRVLSIAGSSASSMTLRRLHSWR